MISKFKIIAYRVLLALFIPIMCTAGYLYVPQIYDLANSAYTGTLAVLHGGTGTTTSTGTGSVVLSASPILTGTPAIAAATGTSVALTSISTINSNIAALNSPISGTLLQMSNLDSTSVFLEFDAYNSTPGIIGRKANGTQATPSATQNNGVLFVMRGYGYGATAFSSSNRTQIALQAAENWTDSAQGTKITMTTTASGTTTTATNLTLDGSGNLSVTGTGTMPLYNTSGTGQAVAHAVIGSCTLSAGSCTVTLSGSAIYSSSSSYVCTGNDVGGTAVAVSSQNQTASSVQFFGTLTHSITFSCVGN